MAPSPINVLDVSQFKDFFKNPAIVSIVVFMWLVYFILVSWARQEDWLDTFRVKGVWPLLHACDRILVVLSRVNSFLTKQRLLKYYAYSKAFHLLSLSVARFQ